jgi:hypothetical protein
LQKSRVEAAEITAAGHQRVEDLDADTDRIWAERDRIIEDTQSLARQLTALAETAAEQSAPGGTLPYDDEVPTADDPPTPTPTIEEATAPLAIDEDADDEAGEDPDATATFEAIPPTAIEDEPAPPRTDEAPPAQGRADEAPPARADEAPPAPARADEAAPLPHRHSSSVIPPASQAANRRTSH